LVAAPNPLRDARSCFENWLQSGSEIHTEI